MNFEVDGITYSRPHPAQQSVFIRSLFQVIDDHPQIRFDATPFSCCENGSPNWAGAWRWYPEKEVPYDWRSEVGELESRSPA